MRGNADDTNDSAGGRDPVTDRVITDGGVKELHDDADDSDDTDTDESAIGTDDPRASDGTGSIDADTRGDASSDGSGARDENSDRSGAGAGDDAGAGSVLAAATDLVGGDVYDGRGQRLISFRPNGTIAPNTAAVDAYFDGVEGVLLAYDASENTVQFVLCDTYEDTDEMMELDAASDRVEITTRAFYDRYDLEEKIPKGNKRSLENTHRFVPSFDESDKPSILGVVSVDLSDVEDVYETSDSD